MISRNQVGIMECFCTKRSSYTFLPVTWITIRQRSHIINAICLFLLIPIGPAIAVKHADATVGV